MRQPALVLLLACYDALAINRQPFLQRRRAWPLVHTRVRCAGSPVALMRRIQTIRGGAEHQSTAEQDHADGAAAKDSSADDSLASVPLTPTASAAAAAAAATTPAPEVDLVSAGGAEAPVAEAHEAATEPTPHPLHQEIMDAHGAAGVLKAILKIPAIMVNFDGALCISHASLEDAELAATALQKLALECAADNLAAAGAGDPAAGGSAGDDAGEQARDANHVPAQSVVVVDRRFGQLLEVVRCQLDHLSISDLSKITWGLAMLEYRDEELLQAVADVMIARLSSATAAFDATESTGGTPELVPQQQQVDYQAHELSTMMLSFAHAQQRIGFACEPLTMAVADALQPQVSKLEVPELAKVAWSCATQSLSAPQLMAAVAEAVAQLPAGMRIGSKDIATLVWALAEQDICRADVYAQLIHQVLPVIDGLSYQDMSNLAYGLAKTHAARREHAESQFLAGAGDLADEGGGRTTTSAAAEREVMAGILARADLNLEQFSDKPLHLSRLLWAMATWQTSAASGSGISSTTELTGSSALAMRAIALAGTTVDTYSAEELVHIIWAYASLSTAASSSEDDGTGMTTSGQELSTVLGRLVGILQGHLADMGAPTVCHLVWAVAALRYPAHELLDAATAVLVNKVQDMALPSVAALAWAYARLMHPANELMDRVVSIAETRLDAMQLPHVASLLWALGTLGYAVRLKCSFTLSPEMLKPLNPSVLANLAFGLAYTDVTRFSTGAPSSVDLDVLGALASDMRPKLLSFSPGELARTAASLASFGASLSCRNDIPSTPATPAEPLVARDDEGTVSGDTAVSGGVGAALVETLLGECTKWVGVFTPKELYEVLHCICTLGHRADALMAAIKTEVEARQKTLVDLALSKGTHTARAVAFQLGTCQRYIDMYSQQDFDGAKAQGRYALGKRLLGRMFA